MALEQSALLNLLGQLKLTDVSDRIRTATESLYQQLIEAEATVFIGAGPLRTLRGADHPAQRLSNQDVDDHGRGFEPEDPPAAERIVFPCFARTAPSR
jgi:hypothetical protein